LWDFDLVHGDLVGAWHANPAILLASPFLLLLWLQSERSAAEPVWQKLLTWGLVLYFLCFGVWRNL
jgi:hypothetical protein